MSVEIAFIYQEPLSRPLGLAMSKIFVKRHVRLFIPCARICARFYARQIK